MVCTKTARPVLWRVKTNAAIASSTSVTLTPKFPCPPLPHQSQGGHHHHQHSVNKTSGHGLHGEEEEDHNLDGVWKGLTALGGVYFMFLIEHFLTLGKMYKDKQKVSFLRGLASIVSNVVLAFMLYIC